MLPVLGMFIVIIFRLSLNSYYICDKYNNYHEENLVIIQNEGTTTISKKEFTGRRAFFSLPTAKP